MWSMMVRRQPGGHRLASQRCVATHASPAIKELVDDYEKRRAAFEPTKTLPKQSTRNVFANNLLRLGQVEVIGFDYDYTLCHYTEELQRLIYNMARDAMVHKLRYPHALLGALEYDPSFAIRGLAIDTEKALLCKISSHQKLSYTGVFRGRQRLSREEILLAYNGSRHIPISYRAECMKPLNDLFSVAQACLFADVIQFFTDHGIAYEPRAVHEDIESSIAEVHTSGKMHKAVVQDLPLYMEPNTKLRELLSRFQKDGKKLFVCTNSSYRYIDAGLRYMVGNDWRQFFDIVLVSAKKPDFYTRSRTFRLFDVEKRQVQWQAVTDLLPHHVYTQGSLRQLIALKGWRGGKVLYIGDSLFADLVEPNRILGWRTGAIIRELEDEIQIQNSPAYQRLAFQHASLEVLLRQLQEADVHDDEATDDGRPHDAADAVYHHYVNLHSELQMEMEALINPNFGSVFRVESHPSQFAFSAQRYVDIYSSRLKNFLEYPKNYTFYPERMRLPHEPTPQPPM
ncbi:hypothetical protein H257_17134 [Aphanomyces astaci]|uniref:5'-nucleotidase domain-containing protein n=1 Tax=Aphanomyces astaci TaxID=112090 RepID=W4FHV2_APHAT|nr:hypothetical protein H257_17134 [Aphanomyces astaci]ETV66333.1 hypothetical protein H257_17134 [Aphanomyces astaci]|eukprot:XP_009844108.1 hypothetical protein H257_17134 [Aphanomyces astaci]